MNIIKNNAIAFILSAGSIVDQPIINGLAPEILPTIVLLTNFPLDHNEYRIIYAKIPLSPHMSADGVAENNKISPTIKNKREFVKTSCCLNLLVTIGLDFVFFINWIDILIDVVIHGS